MVPGTALAKSNGNGILGPDALFRLLADEYKPFRLCVALCPGARPINRTAAMFFGYFAVLSLLMLPAAVAFARRKTSRWFLLSAGLPLLIGGALNWWGLLPTFSWHGYEPDWPPICVGAFLVMMLLAIFGKVSRRRRRQQSSRDFNPHHKYPTRLKKPANRARRHR
jgi:hypothetical protein